LDLCIYVSGVGDLLEIGDGFLPGRRLS